MIRKIYSHDKVFEMLKFGAILIEDVSKSKVGILDDIFNDYFVESTRQNSLTYLYHVCKDNPTIQDSLGVLSELNQFNWYFLTKQAFYSLNGSSYDKGIIEYISSICNVLDIPHPTENLVDTIHDYPNLKQKFEEHDLSQNVVIKIDSIILLTIGRIDPTYIFIFDEDKLIEERKISIGIQALVDILMYNANEFSPIEFIHDPEID